MADTLRCGTISGYRCEIYVFHRTVPFRRATSIVYELLRGTEGFLAGLLALLNAKSAS
jgi:hypothetical protein